MTSHYPENQDERAVRRNILTGEDVIFSPSRGRRPGAQASEDIHKDALGVEGCPFCPGHEELIPPILSEHGTTSAERPWNTRAFANKYPALDADLPPQKADYPYPTWRGHGIHEVIVETPHHEEDLHEMETESLAAVVETYVERVAKLRDAHPQLYPTLFKNHGRKAGATLRHPHAQLIASPVVPQAVRVRERRARRYFARTGRCLACQVIEIERSQGERIIWSDDHFLAVVPYAASTGFEVMIIPKRHCADITLLDAQERLSLALAMGRLSGALDHVVGGSAYNLLFALGTTESLAAPWQHWYMMIRPRFGVDAGFESATGMRINASWPEDNAAVLRDALRQVQAA
jgi:UDPglucose--hexose-1-phosphate uridylyltransferase